MTKQRFIRTLLIGLALTFALPAAAVAQDNGDDGGDEIPVECPSILYLGSISVDPISIAPGGTVTVTGIEWVVPGPDCSFIPPDEVTILFRQLDGAPTRTLGTTHVNDDETFSVEVTIPADADPAFLASIGASSQWIESPEYDTTVWTDLTILGAADPIPLTPRLVG